MNRKAWTCERAELELHVTNSVYGFWTCEGSLGRRSVGKDLRDIIRELAADRW